MKHFSMRRPVALALKLAGVVLLSLALFEAVLRLSGLFFRRAQSAADGKIAILCIGDSFVWGVGGESFPQQLSELLNSGEQAGGYSVINAGKAGANSAQTAQALPALLRAYRPAVVIALFGMNNSWNSEAMSAWDWLKSKSRAWRFFASLSARPPSAQEGAPRGGCEPDFEAGFNYIKVSSGIAAGGLPALPKSGSGDAGRLAQYYGVLSSAYSGLGHLSEAVQSAEKAFALEPADKDALLRLGYARLAFGDYDGAYSVAEQALRLHPGDSEINFFAGNYYARRAAPPPLNPMAGTAVFKGGLLDRRQAYESASKYFLKALELDGGKESYYAPAAEALAECGHYRQALKLAKDGAARFPGSSAIAAQAIRLEAGHGRRSAARAMVLKSLEMFPAAEAATVASAYVQALLEAGRTAQALEEARKLSGYGPAAALAAASALKAGKLYAEGAALLERLPAGSPKGADIKAALADLYLRACQPDKAASAADEALKLDSAHAAAFYYKGCALAFSGDYEKAGLWLEKARRLAPGNPLVLLQLARLNYRKGFFCWGDKAGVCAYVGLQGRAFSKGFESALGYYIQALKSQPYSMPIAEELAAMLYEEGRIGMIPSLCHKGVLPAANAVLAAVIENRYLPAGLEILPDDAFNRRLKRDTASIAEAAAASGARLILSSYPENDFAAVRSAAAGFGVPYVDLTALFRKRFSRRTEFVAYDSFHCNSAGYRLMAEAYAAEIRRLQKR